MEEAELKHLANSTARNDPVTSLALLHGRKTCTEGNITEKVDPLNKINSANQQKILDTKEHVPFNDDIQIIDLESRGEDESISSSVRPRSDSSNRILHTALLNDIPSTLTSYSDRDCETTSSAHSVGSSSSSPKESHARY